MSRCVFCQKKDVRSPKVGSRGVKFACKKALRFFTLSCCLGLFFFKRFVRLFMMYKSFWMLLGRSSGFCGQNTSRWTLSRSHFILFTCTAWLKVSQACLHKTFTSIHMSSMFDERSPIFPRFHSPSLLSSTSFLQTPTSTTSPSDNPATITRNEELFNAFFEDIKRLFFILCCVSVGLQLFRN